MSKFVLEGVPESLRTGCTVTSLMQKDRQFYFVCNLSLLFGFIFKLLRGFRVWFGVQEQKTELSLITPNHTFPG